LATKSELQGWIWDAQKKYDTYQQIVVDCDNKIARLEPVYKALADIKSDFRSARKSTREIIEEKGTWQGEKHTSFCNAGDALDDICGEYYDLLDYAHDRINERISELRAKKRELIPIIGGLWAQIERWRVDIENALN